MFTPRRPVVSADAYLIVLAQCLPDFIYLKSHCLLQPDNIRPVIANNIKRQPAPLRPVILAVIGRSDAYVEAHHSDIKRIVRIRPGLP